VLERKPILWFVAFAFVPAWLLFVLPVFFGPPGSPARQTASLVFWAAAMWAPGLAAIIVTRYVARQSLSELRLRRLGPKRFYLWAWLLPPALAIVAGILTVVLGAAPLDLQFTLLREAMARAPGGEVLPPAAVVAIQSAIALTVGPLFNTIFALGEELGWRGFLLPRLLPLGQHRAVVASGAVWGVWHMPAILQGHNYPSQPVLGVFMMIVLCVLLGAILSWLYLSTGSPWAPALGHASLNATAGLPVLFLGAVDITFAGTVASPIGWIGLAAFVAWLVWTRRLPASAPSSVGAASL
jgi:membrane protease YdiL (CAAX protease family)